MKLVYPSTQRNKEPILSVLKGYLLGEKRVLEIASGSGEHANYFTSELNGVSWQPTDCDNKALQSIEAYRKEATSAGFLSPIALDITGDNQDIKSNHFDILFNCNMVHISPKEATTGLLKLASRSLKREGYLILYGPFFEKDVKTAPSNQSFDLSLKERNPEWGIRNLENIKHEARQYGLEFKERFEMPANNLVVVFQKSD